MKKKPNNKLINFLSRFHITIFIVVVTAGVAVALLLLGNILNIAYGATTPDDSSNLNTSFDENTIRELERFKSSNNNTGNQGLPSGRINPFSD